MDNKTPIIAVAAVVVLIAAAAGGYMILSGHNSSDSEIDAIEPGSYADYAVTGTLDMNSNASLVYICEGDMKLTIVGNSGDEQFTETSMTLTVKDQSGNVIYTIPEEKKIASSPRNEATDLDGAEKTGTETISTIDGDVTVDVWEKKEDNGTTTYYVSQDKEKCYRMILDDSTDGKMTLNAELKEQKVTMFKFKGDGNIGHKQTYKASATGTSAEISGNVTIEVIGAGADKYVAETAYDLDVASMDIKYSTYGLYSLDMTPSDGAEKVETITMSTIDGDISVDHWNVTVDDVSLDFYVANNTIYKCTLVIDGMTISLELTEKNY